MASGIVYAFLNDSGSLGQVQVDETGEILAYSDPNFPKSGLQLKSSCTFDVLPDPSNPGQYYATNLQPVAVPAPAPTTISGPFDGDVTANVGDVITITGATAVVNGNIIVKGGKVIVEQNAQVNGSAHSIVDGVIVARKGGQVKGGINVDGGGNLKVVNKGKIVGGINVQSGGRMIVGNDNGPGYINGTIDIVKIRRLDITGDSKING